ncbi:MAG TPA: flavin reductase [Solirubrobacteraceae bacterium]
MASFTYVRSLSRRADRGSAAAAIEPPPATGVHAERLRAAMGQFATGVTVITTSDADGRLFGSTANSVSSVSLRPPLVLTCLRRESETLAALLEVRRFAINVLHSSQARLSDLFARRAGADIWDAVAYRSADGIPLLEGAIATLQCDLHDVADGGDHAVVVGHVVELDHAPAPDAEPLLFYAGAYRRIGPPPAAPVLPEPTEVALPSREGPLRMLSLSEDHDNTSVAVLTGEPRGRRRVLVYPHVPCLLGDALGSTACPGRARLRAAMALMRREGHGVAVYHREAGTALDACACASGGDPAPRLSEGALDALTRAVRILDLRAVRLLCHPADDQALTHLARAGVPLGELVDVRTL